MSTTRIAETVNVGRLTVTSHRGRSADLLCFRADLLCFSDGHGHGHGLPRAAAATR